MTTKGKSAKNGASGHAKKKGVTWPDLQKQLEKTGYLPAEDADAIIATAHEGRGKKRPSSRRKAHKNGS